MSLNAACRRKLQALQHPNVESIRLNDQANFRTLIVWLENSKTRFYAPADRKALDDIKSQTWPSALEQYLKDLGAIDVAVDDSEACRVRVTDWLLTYAIGMEYSDRATELAKIKKAPASKPSQQQHHQHPATTKPNKNMPQPISSSVNPNDNMDVDLELDIDTPEFRTAIEELANTLGLPHDDSSEAMVRACSAVLEQKLSARALALRAQQQEAKGKSKRTAPPFRIEDYPPGFDTGDPQLNKAAALLRLLYVSDLRALQSSVNALIAAMQDFTAHPKTDASLGKVGR